MGGAASEGWGHGSFKPPPKLRAMMCALRYLVVQLNHWLSCVWLRCHATAGGARSVLQCSCCRKGSSTGNICHAPFDCVSQTLFAVVSRSYGNMEEARLHTPSGTSSTDGFSDILKCAARQAMSSYLVLVAMVWPEWAAALCSASEPDIVDDAFSHMQVYQPCD